MTRQTKAHILKRTKYNPFPKGFIFFDTETKLYDQGTGKSLHVLKLGVAQRYERMNDNTLKMKSEYIIHDVPGFTTWLTSQVKQKQHIYVVAHNLVYDATIMDLFRRLPKSGYKLQSIYSKGQVSIIRFVKGDRRITLIDNGNIFAGSISRWGKIFNFPKMSIDFDTCTDDELLVYCRRDVEIMVRSWSEWMQFSIDNDTVGFRETVASTAFGTWRYKFMPDTPYVHKDETVLQVEREAYHGGRVEVFQQGLLWSDHYYYLDINNMYGHVMRSFEYPTGLQGYTDKITIRRTIEYLRRYAVIASVNVTVDEPVYLKKVNKRAAYPLGTYDVTLTTNELLYAFERGYVNHVHSCAWYKKGDLFTSYVDTFYNLRQTYKQDNNQGFEQICKLFINGLYGKFGQTGLIQKMIGSSKYNEIWTEELIHAQTGKRGQRFAIGGGIYDQYHEGESYHSIPSIAAHITANARLHLWGLMKKAGLENVYYCDTDSIITNRMGYYNLENELHDTALGKLKIELQSPWVKINAPKDYQMEGRKRIKGIRENALQIDDNTYLHEQWIKLAGLIREGFTAGYTSKRIEKHQAREITSGTLTPSGRIVPFVL